ncbi:Ig domain protein group 1 domain protein [Rahnella bonaserana]
MSEPLVDTVADAQPAAPVAVVTSPLDAEKSAFANFVAFVEHGIEKLGSEAEAELVALAKKYL